MNGKKVDNCDFELNVGHYKSAQQRNQGANLSTTGLFTKPFNNLFVKNFPHANFSEADLKARFEKFGEIVSVKVVSCEKDEKSSSETSVDEENCENSPKNDQPQDQQETCPPVNGFGFVCFKNPQDARKALEFYHSLSEKTIGEASSTEKGDDKDQVIDESSNHQVSEKLYVVPALKRELRDALIR